MGIRFTVANKHDGPGVAMEPVSLDAKVEEGSVLEQFLTRLSQRHPDLAPLLEDATHQRDLEIFVNDRLVRPEEARGTRLRDGDTVSLFLKEP